MAKSRYRARTMVSTTLLESLLGLDETAEIVHVSFDPQLRTVDFIIRADELNCPGLQVYEISEGGDVPYSTLPIYKVASES